MRLALSLVLFLGLAAARPFGNPEPYMAPSSLPFICEHILYWFRRAYIVMRPSHASHIAGDRDDAHLRNKYRSSGFSWQLGPGLFGPLGWVENDITIIVSMLECHCRVLATVSSAEFGQGPESFSLLWYAAASSCGRIAL